MDGRNVGERHGDGSRTVTAIPAACAIETQGKKPSTSVSRIRRAQPVSPPKGSAPSSSGQSQIEELSAAAALMHATQAASRHREICTSESGTPAFGKWIGNSRHSNHRWRQPDGRDHDGTLIPVSLAHQQHDGRGNTAKTASPAPGSRSGSGVR